MFTSFLACYIHYRHIMGAAAQVTALDRRCTFQVNLTIDAVRFNLSMFHKWIDLIGSRAIFLVYMSK